MMERARPCCKCGCLNTPNPEGFEEVTSAQRTALNALLCNNSVCIEKLRGDGGVVASFQGKTVRVMLYPSRV